MEPSSADNPQDAPLRPGKSPRAGRAIGTLALIRPNRKSADAQETPKPAPTEQPVSAPIAVPGTKKERIRILRNQDGEKKLFSPNDAAAESTPYKASKARDDRAKRKPVMVRIPYSF